MADASKFFIQATSAEMRKKKAWVQSKLLAGDAPFSFLFGGQPSRSVLSTWPGQLLTEDISSHKTRHTLRWMEPNGGLEVRCVAVEYEDFPVIEWTLFIKNTGSQPSPLIEAVQSLDTTIQGPTGEGFILRTIRGDDCTAESYQPIQAHLTPGTSRRFAPAGGKPTNGAFPCFNLESAGQGVILALGWPGQWSANFCCEQGGGLKVQGGQEHTHLRLLPGEEIRTPLAVLLFWDGTVERAQNLWRRWMINHNLPRPNGQIPPTISSICMGLHQSETGEKQFIDQFLQEQVLIDYWWMDAGWYPSHVWWDGVGTWEPDPERFPNGIRAVSDYAHTKGMRLVLWFEPERVAPGTWLYTQHPEWLLGGSGDRLLNLGNPDARAWLTDHIDRFITNQGVDLYRQDFNIDPLPFWLAADAPDRQGMTENLHLQSYLAFWDELLRRHPGLLIDSCASGGRRNDLETLRRSVPLLRSDFQGPGIAGLLAAGLPADQIFSGNQGHGFGLPNWIPYYGTGEYYNDAYSFRSHLCPSMGIGYDPTKQPVDWAALRKTLADWRKVSGCMLGDYYPLSGYSLAADQWMAWQFHRPEIGNGMLQAFRRDQCPQETLTLKLHGLDPAATYEISDLDKEQRFTATGGSLMGAGLPLHFDQPRQARLIYYQEVIPGIKID